MPGFTVAIVGRPNVGKSTLFNRLIEQRKAIVDNISGVTRDRQYGIADWNGKTFNVIDTGGFVSKSEDIFEKEIQKQVLIALEEADLLLFIVDATTGITHLDDDMADILRRSTKPLFLVANKVDNNARLLDASEFYAMGFDQLFFISSISGSGTGELLDAVCEAIPADAVAAGPNVKRNKSAQKSDKSIEDEWENTQDTDLIDWEQAAWQDDDKAVMDTQDYLKIDEENKINEDETYIPKIAIIGQPNAGKSTLLNALTGEERTIVSNIPGTTRDSIHTHYKLFNKEFVLIDTAGLRKKKNVNEDLEFYSVIRAIRAMDEADLCLLVIDAVNGMTMQDLNIFSLASRKGKGIVILVNKWDLYEKETNTARDYTKKIQEKIAPFSDVPVLFISAKDKTRIYQAVEKTLEVYENLNKRIATSKLNETMLKEIQRYPPPMTRGHNVSIKFVRQVPTKIPSFAFYVNYPDALSKAYRNFLDNKIRSHYNFTGVPIRIFFRKK